METSAPSGTFLSSSGEPSIRPTIFTAEAARISLPRDAGVRPKKIQNALPGGQ
jgi:hypothetical protein